MAADEGDQGRAARLLGAVEAQLDGSEATVYSHTPDRAAPGVTIGAARARLGEEAFEQARAEEQEMSFEQAVAYALENDEASST